MRTTAWHVVKFAWALFNHPHRDVLRIGQIILNTCPDPYAIENDSLTEMINGYY